MVLPAPLPPTMPWMLPGEAAKSTRSQATTRPNRRVIARAPSRTAGRAAACGPAARVI